MVPFGVLLAFCSFTSLLASTWGGFGTYMWVDVVGVPVSFVSMIPLVPLLQGNIRGVLFVQVVDGPDRMRWFALGATAGVVGQLPPGVVGFPMPSMLILPLAPGFFAGPAFEGTMTVWRQESFPAPLRSTAQGSIIGVSRLLSVGLAIVTPAPPESMPRILYGVLAGVMAVGPAPEAPTGRRDVPWRLVPSAPNPGHAHDPSPEQPGHRPAGVPDGGAAGAGVLAAGARLPPTTSPEQDPHHGQQRHRAHSQRSRATTNPV